MRGSTQAQNGETGGRQVKVTQEMIDAFKRHGHPLPFEPNIRAGLEAVLADVPDVEPFTWVGSPDSVAWLHPCGQVVDTDDSERGRALLAEVLECMCDCESGQPWKRIYVLKDEGEGK